MARTRNPWDDAACGWDRHSSVIRTWLAAATVALLDGARIGAGQRVLDLAAGAGDQTLDIAHRVGRGGSVLATDLSARIIEQAARRLKAAGMDNVRTRCADMQELGLEGENFDAAVSRLGLMFCARPLRALQQAHAALAPGARLAALVFSGVDANPCVATALWIAREHAGAPPADPRTPGSIFSLGCPRRLHGLLEMAGFVETEVQTITAPMRLAGCADYIAFVQDAGSPVIATLRALGEPQRRRAWAEIAAALDRFESADGWVGPNELLLCRGVKACRMPAARRPRSGSRRSTPNAR